MNLELLHSEMREGAFYPRLCAVEECESTNLLLRKMALEGAPQGTVVFADRQTAGRGRMGRRFQSPPGGGLYMSLLLRPRMPAADAALLTACSAVSVAGAVEQLCGREARIKWVNDVLLDGKKICGILAESVLSGEGPGIFVLGIGINVNTDPALFPEEVRRVATSLWAAGGGILALETVAAAVLDRFARFCRDFPESLDRQREEYRARLCTLGRTVEIVGEEGLWNTVDIDARFGLVVEREGVRRTLRSGEVSVRARTQEA